MENDFVDQAVGTNDDGPKEYFKKPVLNGVFFIGLLLLSIISIVSYIQVQELIRVNERIIHTEWGYDCRIR